MNPTFPVIFLAAAILRLIAAIWNTGFLALDDYYIFSFSVPAQAMTADPPDNFFFSLRSPLVRILMDGLSLGAFKLGFTDPLNQIRFIYVFFGLYSLAGVYYTYKLIKLTSQERTANIALLLASFHFLLPYVSTRAMIENLSAPFLMIAAYSVTVYYLQNKKIFLVIAVFAIALASLFRFQAGSVILVPLVIIFIRKNYSDLIHFGYASLFSFFVTGGIDFFLRGEFHGTLLKYIQYNLSHSNEYGVSPFYTYFLLMIAVTIPPVLLSRFKNFSFINIYKPLFPALLMFIVFVLLHSAVPHKEERFLIPVFYLFLALISPLYEEAFKKSWRKLLFISLNLILLCLITFFPFQQNTTGIVRFYHTHTELNSLFIYKDSLGHFPVAYAYRSPVSFHFVKESVPVNLPVGEKESSTKTNKWIDDKEQIQTMNCKATIAVREDYLPNFPLSYKKIAVFESSFPEKILLIINPKANKRRGAIHLFIPEGCP